MTRSIYIAREELHRLVWEYPMNKLCKDYGITSAKLARICDQQGIPRPPQGYWTLRAMGRLVEVTPLSPADADQSNKIEIVSAKSTKTNILVPISDVIASGDQVGMASELDGITKLHPLVKVWVRQHRDDQAKRKQRLKSRRHSDFWGFGSDPLPNLTERDLYRFRATSTAFRLLQDAGLTIDDAKIVGNFKIKIGPHALDCTIKEKMRQGLSSVDKSWSAYPDHHQNGLHPSGFLRFSVNTYVAGSRLEWIEKPNKLMVALLPSIVSAVVACGPKLDAEKAEREERERRYEEERRKRYEEQRLREIDERRWTHFQGRAASWEEAQRLSRFIEVLEERLQTEGATEIDGRTAEEWLEWSKSRLDELDPMQKPIEQVWDLPPRW